MMLAPALPVFDPESETGANGSATTAELARDLRALWRELAAVIQAAPAVLHNTNAKP